MKTLFSSTVFLGMLIKTLVEHPQTNILINDHTILINGVEFTHIEILRTSDIGNFTYHTSSIRQLIKVLQAVPDQPITVTFLESYIDLSNLTFN